MLTYGRESVDRIATQSMYKFCNLWPLIVVDCDYAESYGFYLDEMLSHAESRESRGIVPEDS